MRKSFKFETTFLDVLKACLKMHIPFIVNVGLPLATYDLGYLHLQMRGLYVHLRVRRFPCVDFNHGIRYKVISALVCSQRRTNLYSLTKIESIL